jgi:hypothetical protein
MLQSGFSRKETSPGPLGYSLWGKPSKARLQLGRRHVAIWLFAKRDVPGARGHSLFRLVIPPCSIPFTMLTPPTSMPPTLTSTEFSAGDRVYTPIDASPDVAKGPARRTGHTDFVMICSPTEHLVQAGVGRWGQISPRCGRFTKQMET